MALLYKNYFWDEDFSSSNGSDALIKRNRNGNKMCQELEDYLQKRSKLEIDFSKSLAGLGKCFKDREKINGSQMEEALDCFKEKLQCTVNSHQEAAQNFSAQAAEIKKYREDQNLNIKHVKEDLQKKLDAKLKKLSQKQQSKKKYKKKSIERDNAQIELLATAAGQAKEEEKAQTKLKNATEDALAAEKEYKDILVELDNATKEWENSMKNACQKTQEMDEGRVKCIRNELWKCVNTDSKLALDIDNNSEDVRNILEKCEVFEEFKAFINSATIGMVPPPVPQFEDYKSMQDDSASESCSSIGTTHENENKSTEAGMSLIQTGYKIPFVKLKWKPKH